MEIVIGLHSLWRWVVLLIAVVTLVRSAIGWLRGGEWTSLDRQLLLFTTTALDIQLLLGLIIYIVGQRWGDPRAFIAYIHPLVMIVAIAIAHAVSVAVRRSATPVAKFRTLAIGLFVVLLLVTGAIPSYSWSRAWVA